MVKTLEPHIKKAFMDVGFSEEEIKDGCWLLEKPVSKGSKEMKPIAWIALHKFLERVAQRMGIVFKEPKVMNCNPEEVAIWVEGCCVTKDEELENSAWSIGEASIKNCRNEYRWAMAEKRAKDRVILKLLGIAGDMYSEEEADEFKRLTEQQEIDDGVEKLKNEVKTEKAKNTRELNKKVEEAKKGPEGLKLRYESSIAFISKMKELQPVRDAVVLEKANALLDDLSTAKMEVEYGELKKLLNSKLPQVEQEQIL